MSNTTADEFTLTLSNKRIHDFYLKNQNINFEAMNLMLIEFLETLNNDLSSTMSNAVHNEILCSVKDIKKNIQTLNVDVQSINNSIVLKFHDINKEFVENIKHMIGNTMGTNTDKIYGMLDRNTESMLSKLSEYIPKNNEEMSRTIKFQLYEMQLKIQEDLKTQSPETLNNYFTSLDTKLQNIQQPIFSFISANNEQMANNITNLRESSVLTQASQEKVFKELEDFLNKYRTSSSHKGQYSENMLEGVLNRMFPNGEIINSTASKASGDFLLKRNGHATILFENKNYESNVNTEEIKKFLRDIREQNCSGVFISQFSGIVNKGNYFIEIHDCNVLVYIHNVEYNIEKIKTAIDIVDNLSLKLKDFQGDQHSGINIAKDVLDNINSEFQIFLSQKDTMVSTVKDMQKRLLWQIDELKMPDLQIYLNGKYASIPNPNFVCEVCGESFAKKTSLASHKKVHKDRIP
jgi:hypothetical protein